MEQKNIVILGGGFAGIRTALDLGSLCHKRGMNCDIAVVDKMREHLFTPLLYEIATGLLEERGHSADSALQKGACLSFDECLVKAKKAGVRFVHAEVTGVDASSRIVKCASGDSMPFDHLVIALGSEVNDYGIAGIAKNAVMMKSLAGAEYIRRRISEFVTGSDREFNIIIGGAGATGVETSAELANFFQSRVYKTKPALAAPHITLVEAQDDILSSFKPSLRKIARERLHQLGIEILVNTNIVEAREGSVVIKSVGALLNKQIDLLIWAGGIKAPDFLKNFGVALTEKGFIDVDENLRVIGSENIWALGDCASVRNRPAPALAQAAVSQAGAVAKNIASALAGEKPSAFAPKRKKWNVVIPLGGKFAVADVNGFVFSGILAYALSKFIGFWYIIRILPFFGAVSVWLRGAIVYAKND